MTGHEGLSNFCQNIKPIMEKCRDGKKLTKEEQKETVEFYLEVMHYLQNSISV